MSQIEAVKEKLRVIRILKLLKKSYTYEDLSKITGLPITVLNRYVRGKVLPSTKRSKELLEVLSPYLNVEEEAKKRIRFDEHGLFDNMGILGDTALMTLIAETVASALKKGERVLIVDDVVRSGETQKALLEMCRRAGSIPKGMFFLISVGDVLDRLKEEYNIPIDALVRL